MKSVINILLPQFPMHLQCDFQYVFFYSFLIITLGAWIARPLKDNKIVVINYGL